MSLFYVLCGHKLLVGFSALLYTIVLVSNCEGQGGIRCLCFMSCVDINRWLASLPYYIRLYLYHIVKAKAG